MVSSSRMHCAAPGKGRQQARLVNRRRRDFPTVNRHHRYAVAVELAKLLLIVDIYALEVKAD